MLRRPAQGDRTCNLPCLSERGTTCLCRLELSLPSNLDKAQSPKAPPPKESLIAACQTQYWRRHISQVPAIPAIPPSPRISPFAFPKADGPSQVSACPPNPLFFPSVPFPSLKGRYLQATPTVCREALLMTFVLSFF
jgi:hypothetical protein